MKPEKKNIKSVKSSNIPAKQKKPGLQTGKTISDKWWKDKKIVFILLAVLAVTFIVMSPSIKASFVNLDDDVNVLENANVHTFNVHNIFTSTVIGNYNPLTILTFAVDYHFYKENPFPYHLQNIILHLINTFLVFILIMLLGMRKPWALLVALLFGAHPMHIESVAWITERKDVLFGLFYLLSAICYLYHFKTKKSKYLILTYLFFILSLLSKIQAVSLPLTLLLFDYFLNRPLKIRLIIEKIPYFIFSFIVGAIGVYFLGQQKSLDATAFSIIERILVGTYSLCIYLIKSIVPFEMAVIYPFPKPGDFGWFYYCSPFILIVVGYFIYRSVKYTRAVLFGTFLFLVNVMFVLQVVSAGQGFIADRFSYIPYIGLFYVFAYSLSRLYEKRKNLKPIVISFTLLASLAYAGIAWSHAAVWKDTETLFNYELQHYKKVSAAFRNRGNYYRDNKIFDKAFEDYSRLIEVSPDNATAYVSRGRIYFDRGEYDKAFADFNQSIKLDSTDASAYSNRGAVYGYKNKLDLALADFNKAIELDPKWKDAISNRSLIYYSRMQWDKAIQDINAYLALSPEKADSYNLRALCKTQIKDYQGALQDYEMAIKFNPNVGTYFQNRSSLYEMMGNKANALEDIKKAQQLGIKVPKDYLDKLR